MRKYILLFFVLTQIVFVPYCVKGQKFIGPIDSAGYLNKKYDSTITYYWKQLRRGEQMVCYMNLHRADSTHQFYRELITRDRLEKRLGAFPGSAKELRKYKRNHIAGVCSSLLVFPGTLIIGNIPESNNRQGTIAGIAFIAGLIGLFTFYQTSQNHFIKAIDKYNRAVMGK